MKAYLSLGLVLVLLSSCDPVKRLLKRQERTQRIIAEYLAKNPPKVDTVYIKGEIEYHSDTIVNENIYVDTIRLSDTVWIHQTKYRDLIKTVRVTDTIEYRTNVSSGVSNAQYMLVSEQLRVANKAKSTYLISLIVLASLCILAIARYFFS